MCISNTYTCPTCHRSRAETFPCTPRNHTYLQLPTATNHNHPRTSSTNPNSTTTANQQSTSCPSTITQSLLATCLPCTTAYAALHAQTLRRSIAMSTSSAGTSDADGDVVMMDPHKQLLAGERENARRVWGEYLRGGRERWCRRRGISEEEVLYM